MRNLMFGAAVLCPTLLACGGDSAATSGENGGSAAGPGVGGGAGGAPGTGGHVGAGAGGAAGGSAYPAPHPPMPQVVTQNGPVMTAPNIVSISFEGDTLQASLDAFVAQMVAATDYWKGATAEYGVGPLSATTPVHLAETADATLTDGDVRTWLTTKIAAGAGFPQPDANTLYTIFYPKDTSVTMQGGSLCNEFQGYHGDFLLSGTTTYVTYAVIGRCPPPVAGISDLDNVSAIASHEFIEAATDPLALTTPAWSDVDHDHTGWAILGGGGEIGDLCAPFPGVFYDPPGITSLVQRVWSNASAAASHDPCQPGASGPYFNSAPDQDDTITIGSGFQAIMTKGTLVPVGQTKTIALHLYSDAPTSGPWTVSVLDAGAFFGAPPTVMMSLDKTEGQNGDTIMLTIQSTAESPLGATPVWIESDLGMTSNIWVGLVGTH